MFNLQVSLPTFPWCLRQLTNMPQMQDTWVQSPGWENPLEEGIATHSSILAWRILMDRRAWWATCSPWDRKETDMTE